MGSLSQAGPTVRRIALGGHLRRMREACGLSVDDAAAAIRASHSKISRIELGRVGVKQRDIVDLLALYGVTEPAERDAMVSLAAEAKQPGWWHRYGDVLPSWFEVYIGLEGSAASMRTYEVQFVPGLLQTEDYARDVIRQGHPEADEAELERRTGMRVDRQRRVVDADGFRLWAVVDEAALRRPFGGRGVMRAQLEHLLEITELPSVTFQVVPFAAGAHAGCGGPFTILRFAEPEVPDLVFLEQLNSALYLDKPEETDGYMRVMDQLCIQATQPRHTRRLLEQIHRDM